MHHCLIPTFEWQSISQNILTLVGIGRFTFAVGDIGGTIKVSGGVPGAGDAVVLPKLRLVGSCWAADAAVRAGVIVMSGRAVH